MPAAGAVPYTDEQSDNPHQSTALRCIHRSFCRVQDRLPATLPAEAGIVDSPHHGRAALFSEPEILLYIDRDSLMLRGVFVAFQWLFDTEEGAYPAIFPSRALKSRKASLIATTKAAKTACQL